MIDRLEATEKERDALRAELAQLHKEADKFGDGIDWIQRALQAEAKIEEMGRQEPVAFVDYKLGNCFRWAEYLGWQKIKDGARLYALPGAQPAPSVPEGWKLVPTAESRHPGIYKMLSALHAVDNTPGAAEWESYAAFLAAAPEAKS